MMQKLSVPYVNFPQQFEDSKEEVLRAIQGVFERGDFILGKEVSVFEQEFARISNVKYAVGVANGTDSIIMGLRLLGVKEGDEVITASNSWVSSASAIGLIGATPVFADVLPDQNIDPTEIEKKITSRTKCILPVHLTGRCARMPEILAIGKKYGIPVFEDAAQAVTARVGEYTAGNAGIMASFSLHPLKNLNAAGDAGVITTNDQALYEKLKMYRHHGLKNRDEVVFWGYNSRLDTLQAAVLNTRLKKLPEYIAARRKNALAYTKGLQGIVECPIETKNEFHTYHVYVIQCDRRDQLQQFLEQRGIESKIHYPIPIHQQQAAAYLGYKKGSLPVTEKQAERILSLPINQYTSSEQVEWVIESIRCFYGRL